MTKDEALKLALELIQDYVDEYGPHDKDSGAQYVVTAIKEALAEPEHGWTPERIAGIARLKDAQDKRLAQSEQEPVTWRYKIVDVFGRPAWTLKTPKSDTRVLESQPLYTTPPQGIYYTPPQRKPLSDEEIEAMWPLRPTESIIQFARAIEAAHGIGE